MKIKSHTYDKPKTISAKELKLKDSKGLRFFIHKRYKDIFNLFEITEYSTGLSVASGNTVQECMLILEERLKKYSTGEWRRIIKSQCKKKGIKYPMNK